MWDAVMCTLSPSSKVNLPSGIYTFCCLWSAQTNTLVLNFLFKSLKDTPTNLLPGLTFISAKSTSPLANVSTLSADGNLNIRAISSAAAFSGFIIKLIPNPSLINDICEA